MPRVGTTLYGVRIRPEQSLIGSCESLTQRNPELKRVELLRPRGKSPGYGLFGKFSCKVGDLEISGGLINSRVDFFSFFLFC